MFGRDDGFKPSELAVDDVSGGYGPPDGGPGIDPDRYVFRSTSDDSRPVSKRYRDVNWGKHHSIAVGGRPDRAFYGVRAAEQPAGDDAYAAVVECEAGDRIASVGIRRDVYDRLDARGHEDLRSAAVNAVEELGPVAETPQDAFEELVLGGGDAQADR